MCKRLEAKMGEVKDVPTKTKVVRITYCDPDATDSSSDDDDDHYCYYNRLYFKPSQDVRIFPQKKVLKKTFLQINLDAQNPNSTQVIMTKSQSVRRALPVGVRIRKSGRYGAEVREPFTKRRLWLGTFATPEEASRAYLAKKSEILMMTAKMKKKAGKVVLSANSSSGGADPVVGGGGEKDGHVDSYVRHKRTESFGENKVVEGYVGCENDEEVMGAWRMNESGNNFAGDCNGFCGFSSIGDEGSHLP